MHKRPVLSLVLFSLFLPALALAAQRTFVSAGSGSDSNTCTRSAPCRNFAAAIAQTDSGGEVVVLDSGGYGAVTITDSVSLISPPGVYAGISGFTGAAIEVNAQNHTVVIKGLSLNGQGGLTGIRVTNAKHVHVENVTISGFGSNGLEVAGDITEFFGMSVQVKDSIVRNCSNSGIYVGPASGRMILTVDGARLEANGWGFVGDSGASVILRNVVAARNSARAFSFRNGGSGARLLATVENAIASDGLSTDASDGGFVAENGAHVAIRNSAAVRNFSTGFWAKQHTSTTEMTVDRCLADHNDHGFLAGAGFGSGSAILAVSNSTASGQSSNGIVAGSNGIIRAFGNTVTRNGFGLNGAGGTFYSGGNNFVHGNTTETTGTINAIPPM